MNLYLLVIIVLAVGSALAQNPLPAQPAQTPATPAAASTEKSGAQGMTGILMDANCEVIRKSVTTSSSSLTQTPAPATEVASAPATPQGTPGAATSQATGIAPATQSGLPRTTPPSAAAPVDPAARDLPRSTASAAAAPATPSANPSTDQTDVTTPARTAATTPADPHAAHIATRARTEPGAGSLTTVREKYSACQVTPNSTMFAMHADGKLHIFDDASNQMIKEKMNDSAFRGAFAETGGSPKWATVTVTGTPSGDRYTVTTITR